MMWLFVVAHCQRTRTGIINYVFSEINRQWIRDSVELVDGWFHLPAVCVHGCSHRPDRDAHRCRNSLDNIFRNISMRHSAGSRAPPHWWPCTSNRWPNDIWMIDRKYCHRMVAYKSNAPDGMRNPLDRSMNAFGFLDSNGTPRNWLLHRHNSYTKRWRKEARLVTKTNHIPLGSVLPRASLAIERWLLQQQR